jgi:hypothetical protein
VSRLRPGLGDAAVVTLLGGAIACAAIAAAESWRAAALALAAALAIGATRIRFSLQAAACLLVLGALSVLVGPG